eukprot:gene45763-61968_t
MGKWINSLWDQGRVVFRAERRPRTRSPARMSRPGRALREQRLAPINPFGGKQDGITILGAFVADLAVRAPRLPSVGETLIGSGSSLGPGGKGSNQAVAAARLGARVRFITRLGRDAFADMARATWIDAGVDPDCRRQISRGRFVEPQLPSPSLSSADFLCPALP